MTEENNEPLVPEEVRNTLEAQVQLMSTREKYWVLYKKNIMRAVAAVVVLLVGMGALAALSAYSDSQARKEAARKEAARLAQDREERRVQRIKGDIEEYVEDTCYEQSGIAIPVPTQKEIRAKISLESEWKKFTSKETLSKDLVTCIQEENRKLVEVYPGEIANTIQEFCGLYGAADATLTSQNVHMNWTVQWEKIKPEETAIAEVLACVVPVQTDRFQNVYLPEANAEVARACEENATSELTAVTAASEISYSSKWDKVTTKDQLVQQLVDCVAGKKAAARAARLSSCTENFTVDQIVKDPDGVTGQCFVLHVNISQFDSATGTCAFRGDFDRVPHTYSYQYSENSMYEAENSYDCPELAGVDNADFVKIWAESLGSYSYSTTIGGTATVPKFEILQIEVERKG